MLQGERTIYGGPRWIELRKAGGAGSILYLPHAGSFGLAGRFLLDRLPAGMGLVAADYPDRHEPSPRAFDYLSLNLAEGLRPYLKEGATLLGVSFGGHLAFRIARICETGLGYSFGQVVLVAVSDPRELWRRLGAAQSDIATLLARGAIPGSPADDSHIFEEVRSRIEKDLRCLRTLDPQRPGKIKSELIICNGVDDPWCDQSAAEAYWGKRTFVKAEFLRLNGGHLPGAGDWRRIIDRILRAGSLQASDP